MRFKGWQMVYTGMMMEFSVVGFVFYCFPLMFSELEKDLGASQTQLSSALSLFFIFSTLASIFLGRILDKYSIKGIMTLGVQPATNGADRDCGMLKGVRFMSSVKHGTYPD